MDMTTILIIVVVVLLLGGGGFYGRGRWYRAGAHCNLRRETDKASVPRGSQDP